MLSRNCLVAAVAVVAALAGCSTSSTSPSGGSATTSARTGAATGGGSATTPAPSPVATDTSSSPRQVPGLGKMVARYDTFAGPMAVLNGKLYVSNGLDGERRLQQVDAATGRLNSGVRTPPGMGHELAVGDGVLWLTHPYEDPASPPAPITEVDVARQRVRARFTEPNAYGAAAAGGHLWALDEASDRVNEIDPASGRIVRRIGTDEYPFCIRSAFGSVWVGSHHGNSVARIDPRTGKIVASIDSVIGPGDLADGAGSLWVSNWNSDSITRIDARTNTDVATIEVGGDPNAITFAYGAVWVFDPDSAQLTRIDPTTNAVVNTIALETGQLGSYLAAAGGFLWVAVPGVATFKIDPHS